MSSLARLRRQSQNGSNNGCRRGPRTPPCARRTSSCRCTFIGFRGVNQPRRGRNSSSLRRGSLAQRSTPPSLSTPDTILGTSGCASPRTGTCSPPCAQARPRSSMVRSKPSSRRACASLRAKRPKPPSLSRRPDLKFGSRAGRYRGRRRASRYREHDRLQGHDVQRHPEPGVDFRLYERLLDAQVRPDRRVCPPAAQPYGSPRICDLHPAPRRRSDCGRTDAAAHLGLYREGEASFVQAREEEAVARKPELRARRHGLSVWRDRGRRARVQAARVDQPCCVTALRGLPAKAMIINIEPKQWAKAVSGEEG